MAVGKRKESSSQSAAGAASPETSSKTSTSEKEVIVRNGDVEYDVTSFLHYHPGGYISLMKYQGLDISNTMQNTHSPAARYLLASYSEKNIPDIENMEHGINWDRPMLAQVGHLGSRYAQWVENPVDKPLRLFHANFLEALTKTPWWVIPLVWIPVILIFLYTGWNKLATSDRWISGVEMAVCFSFGILMWTLIEYSLHRWLFHSHPPESSPILITAHFLIHGLHHKVPFDRHRLVFPPVPAAILAFLIYNVARIFISQRVLPVVVAGGISGYLIYDMIHYYLHYGSPAPDNYFYKMKRYHNKHHFSHQNTGFGISSDIWDRFFNTQIILNKLKITLQW